MSIRQNANDGKEIYREDTDTSSIPESREEQDEEKMGNSKHSTRPLDIKSFYALNDVVQSLLFI